MVKFEPRNGPTLVPKLVTAVKSEVTLGENALIERVPLPQNEYANVKVELSAPRVDPVIPAPTF